ncbi:hypothetical protein ABB37_06469 [Leptomonas pyrrhocoris]|uniref:Uncharacterized protein n=1 Tax=Leptomonas pyrrhocoris TaxID=157538 RepID=A0A0M9FY64_LEPPY|nr:hypothetical protein ABB37_06469 [Leptomonas pyrrhocoris]XP_015656778.1 hypothetical protein ABB37_06469 [Leptomonas pyrrhocoris]KPA78338.1 hypothetical protein ABB37_06469 [Leptomonas pyrrhocoris]KPA78339.1 hypothetical protein ABB37_06469 [Leptomonas pyrrhocoris]|eukprot:XP_015656777.1 hypothetical protein ABB37_06469 [Leptomonas pyrrhocoris]
MWKTSPAKPSLSQGGRRKAGTGGDGSSGSGGGLSSVALSPPPRLAPLLSVSASPSSSASPTTQRECRFFETARGEGRPPHPRSTLRSSAWADAATDVSLSHATPGVSRVGVVPPLIGFTPTNSSTSCGSSHSRNNGVPSSATLWRMGTAHPHPPHLAALPVHRPWPVELCWRRSKPLTRHLTTTRTATEVRERKAHRQSKDSREGRAESSPRALVPNGDVALKQVETHVVDAGHSRAGSYTPARAGAVAPGKCPSLFPSRLSSSQPAPEPPCCRTEVNAPVSVAQPSMKADRDSGVDALTSPAALAVDLSTEDARVLPAPCAATEAPFASATAFLFRVEALQSDYAQAHQLPQLFAEMVQDLAMAQPLSSAPDGADSGVVAQWMQHWFRNRYDRCEARPEWPSSPPVRRALRDAPLHSATKKEEKDSLSARPGEPPQRSKRTSATLSTATSAVFSAASSSSNHRFVPLTVQPAGTAVTVASSRNSPIDDASLCASLNSADATHNEHPPLALRPPPPLSSASTSASSSQHSSAAGMPKAANSKSPPTSASAAHARRLPRPISHSVVNAAKISGAGNAGGAAVAGPGRGPAKSACTVAGLLTSASASEAAHASK